MSDLPRWNGCAGVVKTSYPFQGRILFSLDFFRIVLVPLDNIFIKSKDQSELRQ